MPNELTSHISNNTAKVGDKINLAIENIVVERSITNSIQLKGDIKNNSPLDLQDIKISAEYFDKAGTLLEKVEHFITSPSYILKPNGQVSFNILEVIGFGFQKLGDFNIVANAETVKWILFLFTWLVKYYYFIIHVNVHRRLNKLTIQATKNLSSNYLTLL